MQRSFPTFARCTSSYIAYRAHNTIVNCLFPTTFHKSSLPCTRYFSQTSPAEYSKGLVGVIGGETSISTVGVPGMGLTYRGYPVIDLARHSCFEEVLHLLLYGELPTKQELTLLHEKLQTKRDIPDTLKKVLSLIPKDTHPMEVLRTGCSFLGCLEREQSFNSQEDVAIRIIASYNAILLYWYHKLFMNIELDTSVRSGNYESQAAHFMRLLNYTAIDPTYNENVVKTIDSSFILYADHDYNASTFSCRVTGATRTDIYSAICAAIGTLRGPLHGGANQEALILLRKIGSEENVQPFVDRMLAKKQLMMGFGHRMYKQGDPRSDICKALSYNLINTKHGDEQLYRLSEKLEGYLLDKKKMRPNVDFYMASAYAQCGIPTSFFTPLFAIARTAGWCAHLFEQRAADKILRPASLYVGSAVRPFVPISQR